MFLTGNAGQAEEMEEEGCSGAALQMMADFFSPAPQMQQVQTKHDSLLMEQTTALPFGVAGPLPDMTADMVGTRTGGPIWQDAGCDRWRPCRKARGSCGTTAGRAAVQQAAGLYQTHSDTWGSGMKQRSPSRSVLLQNAMQEAKQGAAASCGWNTAEPVDWVHCSCGQRKAL